MNDSFSLMRAVEGYFAIRDDQGEGSKDEFVSLHKRYPPAGNIKLVANITCT